MIIFGILLHGVCFFDAASLFFNIHEDLFLFLLLNDYLSFPRISNALNTFILVAFVRLGHLNYQMSYNIFIFPTKKVHTIYSITLMRYSQINEMIAK